MATSLIHGLPTVAALGLFAALVGCAGPERADVGPSNVLLLTIDTLRADHLGSYGHFLETSPNIDRLAQRGVRFTDCTVQWPKTWPSMASMLTGSYPRTTGVRLKRRVLQPELLLLSEVFGEGGFRTGAVVSNYNLSRQFGFDQGFEHFVESWEEAWARESGGAAFRNETGKVKRYTDARIVTDQALAWLRGLGRKEPFFLWLHYMDPHGPYIPPAGYESRFEGAYPHEPTPVTLLPKYQIQRDSTTGEPIADMAFYRTQYDREIRFLDDELARLLDEMERIGVDLDRTVIALAADHGESLGEHDYYLEHGMLSYQASAHSPLILVNIGRLQAGRVVEQPVGLIDLAPTLLELTGLEAPDGFEGRSLVGLMEGDRDDAPEYVFMEAGYAVPTQLTVRHGRWKLIHVRSEGDRQWMTGDPRELYDVVADPGELHNLADRHPEVVEQLGEVLRAWDAGEAATQPGEAVDLEQLDPRAREMLRSLGYVE